MKGERIRQWGVIGLLLAMSLNQLTPILAAMEETAVTGKNIEGEVYATSSNAKNENGDKKDYNREPKEEPNATSSNANAIQSSNNVLIEVDNATEGELETAVLEELEFNNVDSENVTILKISGILNESDFNYIRYHFPNLVKLNLEGITNTKIPDNALKNSDNDGDVKQGKLYYLEDVKLPDHITEIGDSAFRYCRALGELDLSNVKKIGENAFAGCYKLIIKDGILNSDLTEIPAHAFDACYGIKELDLSFVKTLGENAFSSCNNLTIKDGELNSELTTIPAYAFNACWKIGTLDLSHVTDIGRYAFSISGVKIKDGILNPKLTEIPTGAFFVCTQLDKIDLSNVNAIYNDAFSGCTNLKVMVLPTQRPTIDDSALHSVSALMLLVEDGKFYDDFSDFPEGSGYPSISGAERYEKGDKISLQIMPDVGNLCSYQWYYEEEPLNGEVSNILTIINVQEHDSGTYTCKLTVAGHTFKIAKDITVSPIPIYTLTTSATEGGTVTSGGIYERGTSCTVNATADENYKFVKWTENGYWVSDDAEYTFTLTDDCNLIANFEKEKVKLELMAGSGGSAYNGGYYDKGTACTVVAKPYWTHKFVSWTMNDAEVSKDEEYTFIITDNCTLRANFENLKSTLRVLAEGGGTVTPGGVYNKGTYCTIQATPDVGYNFINWTKDGTEVSDEPEYMFTLEDDCTLIANFKKKEMVVLTVLAGKGGEVNAGGTYEKGSICSVEATAATGYEFVNWTVNNTEISTDAEFVFSLISDVTLKANFQMIKKGSSGGSSGGGGSSPIITNTGQWIQDNSGWWYQYKNGSYPKEEWIKLNNSWYYFNQDGYMTTGWNYTNNKWYWLDQTTGKMATDTWVTDQGNWYYMGNDGVMITGWLKYNDAYYFLSQNKDKYYGHMLCDQETPDGYYVNPDGIWVP